MSTRLNDRKKTVKASLPLRLWAVDVCPVGDHAGITIVLVAASMETALQAAERRYPARLCSGSEGFALELDHCVFDWGSGQFDTVEVGKWWGSGYLPHIDSSERVQ